MGLQELLIHFHPFFAVVVFPVIILAGSLWLPYIKYDDNNHGIWFLSEKGKKAGIWSMYAGIIITGVFIMISEILPDPETILGNIPSVITTGLIPFIIVVATMFLYMKYLKGKFLLNRSEYIQSVIIILIFSYTVLSITGIMFRGEGMKLVWPWM